MRRTPALGAVAAGCGRPRRRIPANSAWTREPKLASVDPARRGGGPAGADAGIGAWYRAIQRMLERLRFQGVGPAARMEIDFKSRINFLAGDNGLGKSFLLDAAWWALTRTWARGVLLPHPPPSKPTIEYAYTKRTSGSHEATSAFERATETWPNKRGRPPIPGLVIYAQVDGGFSVWDPARNYWKAHDRERPDAFHFQPDEVWGGLPKDKPVKLCNGLITDWANWQLEGGEAFGQLKRVLEALAPSPKEPLAPGRLRKISVDDARRHPTLVMPYGQDVALAHASAGIRRIAALAYLLVWTWQEHVASAELRGEPPARQIIFLIDEIEAHLHPQWQRRIVPAILDVMEALTGDHDVPVQLLAATHSPMVLASVETRFDTERDGVWELDLQDNEVVLSEFPWHRRGDANAWLTSSVFDLAEPRSIEAEDALRDALELLQRPQPSSEAVERVDRELRAALGDTDRFWLRWTQFVRDRETTA